MRQHPPACGHYNALVATPIGDSSDRVWLGISTSASALLSIDFLTQRPVQLAPPSQLSRLASEQLSRYFDQPDRLLDLPLDPAGTTFQRTVWRALMQIPRGQTRTYGQLAKQLKTSPRAIGNACRHNPLPVVIPCHRVVSRDGLGGFMGQIGDHSPALMIKHWLIAHEQDQAVAR